MLWNNRKGRRRQTNASAHEDGKESGVIERGGGGRKNEEEDGDRLIGKWIRDRTSQLAAKISIPSVLNEIFNRATERTDVEDMWTDDGPTTSPRGQRSALVPLRVGGRSGGGFWRLWEGAEGDA